MVRAVQLGPALVAHRIKEMDGELKELVARAPPEKAVRPLAETGPRDLTFEEKRKLSIVRFGLPATVLCRAHGAQILQLCRDYSELTAGCYLPEHGINSNRSGL